MVLLFADDCFLQHDTGQHPESADRLRTVHRHLETTGTLKKVTRGKIAAATLPHITRVHSGDYIKQVQRFASGGGGRIESDTVVSRDSYDVAIKAAGTAIAAVDEVSSGKARHALCLIRPPGHHALPTSAMGFCLFNNVAIAAEHARQAHHLSRVLVVDWDVHHGNGTQDMFYDDEHVYFFSAHRSPFYPGTGAADETGTRDGLGTVFNLPLKFGIAHDDYCKRFQAMLQDAARKCRPELVLISAGFDAHKDDPIGSLGLDSEDFRTLTDMLVEVADEHCEGKLVSLLEGGYNVNALAESVEHHLQGLIAAETKAK